MSAKPEPWRDLPGVLKKHGERLRRLENRPVFYGSGLEVVDDGQIIQDGAVTIPANGLFLVDGGDVVMLDQNMVELFRLGIQPFGDRGIVMRRADGSIVFEVRKVFGETDVAQSYVVRDRQGKRIGGDSILSPTGFDAPHINHPFVPVDYTSSSIAQSTSSTSFVATHEHRGFRQNPAMGMQVMVKCSDEFTSAEVQVFNVLTGTYLGGFLGSPGVHTIAVPAGTTTFSLFEFSSRLAMPGSMSDAIQLEIHARVTGGSGLVSVAPVRTVGSGF